MISKNQQKKIRTESKLFYVYLYKRYALELRSRFLLKNHSFSWKILLILGIFRFNFSIFTPFNPINPFFGGNWDIILVPTYPNGRDTKSVKFVEFYFSNWPISCLKNPQKRKKKQLWRISWDLISRKGAKFPNIHSAKM